MATVHVFKAGAPPPRPPIYNTFVSLKLQDSKEEELMRIYRSSWEQSAARPRKGAEESRAGNLDGRRPPLAS